MRAGNYQEDTRRMRGGGEEKIFPESARTGKRQNARKAGNPSRKLLGPKTAVLQDGPLL